MGLKAYIMNIGPGGTEQMCSNAKTFAFLDLEEGYGLEIFIQ